MSEPYIGELRLMSHLAMSQGWLPCDGRILAINDHAALFSLLGVTYGGNGTTHFALPDLRGRVPIHRGPSAARGASFGVERHVLTVVELPPHRHPLRATRAPGDQAAPALLAAGDNAYADGSGITAAAHPQSFSSTGGSQPHENRPPSLALRWFICVHGIYPGVG